MPQAIWNGKVIAESDNTVVVEANHYFPPDSLNRTLLRESDHHTVCGWKGTASYFDIVVDGKTNQQAGWYYPDPKEAASNIRDHVAFWKGVEVKS
jgi:uncharacterized protein (DUF427 family)